MSQPLHIHQPRPHTTRNANTVHAARQASGSAWERIKEHVALWLTQNVGSLECAIVFLGIGIGSLIGVWTSNAVLAATFGAISSYVLQLVLLAVLQKGSNVIAAKAEIQSDELFKFCENTYHDVEQTVQHLNAQDAQLVRQEDMLTQLVRAQAALANQHDALHAKVDALTPPQPPPAPAMPQRDASGRFVKAQPAPTEGAAA